MLHDGCGATRPISISGIPRRTMPTGWIWTFHGPAHLATVALADKVEKEAVRKVFSLAALP